LAGGTERDREREGDGAGERRRCKYTGMQHVPDGLTLYNQLCTTAGWLAG